ncbi:MAG: hypothetical protein JO288_08970, partial [Hyphomicrobiales bacterium]|nr:hypothetical protein [Hyphomicrobiales bacterium]
MPAISLRHLLACAPLMAVLLGAAPAFAADKPATAEGALALRAFFAKFLPAAVQGPHPLLAVTPEGADYLLAVDLSALNDLIKETGASYDPATVVYKLVEQEDGKWRVSLEQLPTIGFRAKDATGSFEIQNYRGSALIDPAIAWFLSGSSSAAKGALKIASAKLAQTIDFDNVSADLSTTASDDGSVSTAVKEVIADIAATAKGFGEKDQPINWSARIDKALIDLGVDGLRSRKAFDLWSLIASHPGHGELVGHESEIKGLLKDIARPGLKIAERVEAQRTVVASAIGAVALADFKYELGAASMGPQSEVKIGVSADGLSLPAGLAPPNAADLVPSKFDLAVAVKGFDLTAAADEAIADMRLTEDGPRLSSDDQPKVVAALLGPGPLRIEIAPSHVVA